MQLVKYPPILSTKPPNKVYVYTPKLGKLLNTRGSSNTPSYFMWKHYTYTCNFPFSGIIEQWYAFI